MLERIIKCIRCGEGVKERTAALSCLKCGTIYKIRDGVIMMNFRNDEYLSNYERICRDDLRKEKTPTEVKHELSDFILSGIGRQRNKLIADFGSGDSYVLNRISGNFTIAVDIASEYLRRKCSNVDIRINADLEDLPINKEVLDIGICTDVIEHVMSDDKVLENIYSVLKPGSFLYLAVPWKQDLGVYKTPEYKKKYNKYKYVHLRSIDENYMHKKIFTKFNRLKEKLITCGMKHMDLSPYPIKIFKLQKMAKAL